MPTGRPEQYQPEMNEVAYKLCVTFGADDVKMAEFFGVSKVTLNAWKNKYPKFLSSIKKGKDAYDTHHVEATLLERALGFKKDVAKVFHYRGRPVIVEYKEYFPPDTTAQIFWLKNRQPERWRDKQIIEVEENFSQLLLEARERGRRLQELMSQNEADNVPQIEGNLIEIESKPDE